MEISSGKCRPIVKIAHRVNPVHLTVVLWFVIMVVLYYKSENTFTAFNTKLTEFYNMSSSSKYSQRKYNGNTWSQSRLSRKKTHFSYLINEERICHGNDTDDDSGDDTSDDPRLVMIIVVISSPGNRWHRDYIRQHWGLEAKRDNRSRLIFMLGRTAGANVTLSDIERESTENRDVIVADFVDSYRNLTLKSLSALQWVHAFCNRARFVLKIDDDMMLKPVAQLLDILDKRKVPDKFICGKLLSQCRVVRNRKHKWFISEDQYLDVTFPSFCHGPAYIVPKRINDLIAVESIPYNKVLPIEDVYVTGFLRLKLGEGLDDSVFEFNHAKPIRVENRRYLKMVYVLKGKTLARKRPRKCL